MTHICIAVFQVDVEAILFNEVWFHLYSYEIQEAFW